MLSIPCYAFHVWENHGQMDFVFIGDAAQQLWKSVQKTQSTPQGSKEENLDFLSEEMKGPDLWQALLSHNHIT